MPDTTRESRRFKISSPLLAGLLYAFILMAAASLVASLLLRSTGVNEKSLPSAVWIIHAVCLVCGGFAAGRRSGRRGWYYGGMLGLAYALIVAIVGFLGFDRMPAWQSLPLAGAAFGMASLGGMLGVNARK